MEHHYVIPPLTSDWYTGLAVSVLYVTIGMLLIKMLKPEHKTRAIHLLGVAILILVVFTQYYDLFVSENWGIAHSLPLQLCDLSLILAAIAILTRNQFFYEWALLVSFPAAIHSLLTPELTHGYSGFWLFEYYSSHSTQILAPLLLTFHFGMRPREGSWLKVFIAVNIVLVLVFALNLATGANYIYLLEKPAVDNPLLIGPWPWYIIGVEIAGMVHIILFYFIFRRFVPRVSKSSTSI